MLPFFLATTDQTTRIDTVHKSGYTTVTPFLTISGTNTESPSYRIPSSSGSRQYPDTHQKGFLHTCPGNTTFWAFQNGF